MEQLAENQSAELMKTYMNEGRGPQVSPPCGKRGRLDSHGSLARPQPQIEETSRRLDSGPKRAARGDGKRGNLLNYGTLIDFIYSGIENNRDRLVLYSAPTTKADEDSEALEDDEVDLTL